MNADARAIQKTYLLLLTLQTLSASFIWGVNTLFLLDAGLTNFEAFAANAFFTLGMVIFEIPTGVVADSFGRRLSYLIGTVTLIVSTLLYLWMWQVHAGFWPWALVSMALGLGFTFFSGAVDAWLVDALTAAKYFDADASLESVFGRGQIAIGASTLIGSVAGGFVAQTTNLGVPYLLRAGLLAVNLIAAYFLMFDLGFDRPPRSKPLVEMKSLLKVSFEKGLRNRELRWIMLTSPFLGGVMFYVFYAMQPYLLQLYGHPKAYGIAGLAAASVAGAQMIGGAVVSRLTKLFKSRVQLLFSATALGAVMLLLMSWLPSFWSTVFLLVLWALIFAVVTPVRQAYLNQRMESKQRATLLSFDSVLNSTGSAVTQPLFGKSADLWGYPTSYFICAIFQSLALPFFVLAKRESK